MTAGAPAAPVRDTVRIAALGDVHYGTGSQGALQPLFAEIGQRADVLLLCGDVTNHGLPEEAARQASLEGGPSRPQVPERGPAWFRKMDRNRDGDVSRREWLGTAEQFRAIDRDGDGLISLEEAVRFDRRRGSSR